MNFREKWKFINDALTGEGGFLDGSYIDKYTRETDEKYINRKKIAYYSNPFESKVSRYIGYLYKKPPLRTVFKNRLIEEFIRDCDNQGTHLDIFMSRFTFFAKAKGAGLVLIDNVKEIPETYQDQIEKRAFPYIQSIPPESVIKYKLDQFGNFEFISFHDKLDQSTAYQKKIIEVERYFDRESWSITHIGDSKIIDSGSHNLGICPVVYFSERGTFESLGEFSKMAWISKRLYNLYSEQDEQLRSNTFSLLTIKGNPSSDLSLSTDNALFYTGEVPPKFIAPPSEPMDAYSEKIEKLEALMDKIGYDVTSNRMSESGISLSIKFQGLNSSLASFAQSVEDFEGKIFDIVKAYLGVNDEVVIAYKKDFSIIDITKEVETLQMISQISDIPTYRAIKLRQIIKSDLQNVTDEEMNQIISEIEDQEKGRV